MTRQQALNIIWRRLIAIFCVLLTLSVLITFSGGSITVVAILFIFGNAGSYINIHKSLGSLQDHEVVELSSTWVGLIAPSFVGGLLAIVLYVIFLSGIIQGGMFPQFVPDIGARDDINSILDQHASEGMEDYAKLLFWGFVAGYNQKYVVDIIESIKSKT